MRRQRQMLDPVFSKATAQRLIIPQNIGTFLLPTVAECLFRKSH